MAWEAAARTARELSCQCVAVTPSYIATGVMRDQAEPDLVQRAPDSYPVGRLVAGQVHRELHHPVGQVFHFRYLWLAALLLEMQSARGRPLKIRISPSGFRKRALLRQIDVQRTEH